jgi:hypothetical protein
VDENRAESRSPIMWKTRSLFEEAARCRELAKTFRWPREADLLNHIADEFDRLARERVRVQGRIGEDS